MLVQRRRLLPTMTTTKRSTLESTLELGECSTAGILASWTHLSFSLHAGWQTPWPASTAFTRLLSTTGAGTLSALSSSQRLNHHPGRSALIAVWLVETWWNCACVAVTNSPHHLPHSFNQSSILHRLHYRVRQRLQDGEHGDTVPRYSLQHLLPELQ